MEKEILDPEDAISEAQEGGVENAYLTQGPAEDELFGNKIHPFTGRRRALVFQIGFEGESILDVTRIVWASTLDPAQLNRAFLNREKSIDAFLTWGEENECLDPSGKNYDVAFKFAQRIYDSMTESTAEEDNGGGMVTGKDFSPGEGTGHPKSAPMS